MKNLNVIHIANITKRTVNRKYPPGQSQTPLQYHPKDLPPPPRFVRETPPHLSVPLRIVRETIPSEVPRRVVLLSFLSVYLYLSLSVSIYLYLSLFVSIYLYLSLFVLRERPSPAKSPGGSVVSWGTPPALAEHTRYTPHTRARCPLHVSLFLCSFS